MDHDSYPYEEFDQDVPVAKAMMEEGYDARRWNRRRHKARKTRDVRQGRKIQATGPYGGYRHVYRAPKFSHIPGVSTRKARNAKKRAERRMYAKWAKERAAWDREWSRPERYKMINPETGEVKLSTSGHELHWPEGGVRHHHRNKITYVKFNIAC